MRKLIIHITVAACIIPCATASAHVGSKTKLNNCNVIYNVKQYKAYASRVYQRDDITRRAYRQLHRMIRCQIHTNQAKKWRARYKKIRKRMLALGRFIGSFHATSYGPPWGGINGGGVTAIGVNLRGSPQIYGVAVDPGVIRLGSYVKIRPNPFGYNGCFRAFDTGGAINGSRIDFYDWRGRGAQYGWGGRGVRVYTCHR